MKDTSIGPETALKSEEVRTAIRAMRRKQTVWFLVNLAACLAAAGIFFISSGLVAVLALGLALLFGLFAPILGLFLLRFSSEARTAVRDYRKFKGDPECFRRLHKRIYKFP